MSGSKTNYSAILITVYRFLFYSSCSFLFISFYISRLFYCHIPNGYNQPFYYVGKTRNEVNIAQNVVGAMQN